MTRSVFLLVMCALASSCVVADSRATVVGAALAKSDEQVLRTRPELEKGKLARMTSEPFGYFRGALPVYADDTRTGTYPASAFALEAPLVASPGDAHPENFGVLTDASGGFFLSVNDFDAADRVPYLWDVRRLASGVALASRLAFRGSDVKGDASHAVLRGYLGSVEACALGKVPPAIQVGGDAIANDLFARARRDRGQEVALYVSVHGGVATLKRGAIDPEDPEFRFEDVSQAVRSALPGALEQYRSERSVVRGPIDVLDAVRVFGSGVSSFAKVRYYALLRDLKGVLRIVELKELGDSNVSVGLPPYVHADSVGARVTEFARALWPAGHEEPYWGKTSLLGLPMQVRLVSEAHKTFRVQRLRDKGYALDALTHFAGSLGAELGRMHCTSALAIRAHLRAQNTDFVAVEGASAEAYGARAEADQAVLSAILRENPLLGVREEEGDRARSDVDYVFGLRPQRGVR